MRRGLGAAAVVVGLGWAASGCACSADGDGNGGAPDGGLSDGGAPDGGLSDGGAPDGGARDGGADTGGTGADAASRPADAARDAGPGAFSAWTECGWSDPTCTCDAVLACAAVAGGVFEPLGSTQARVCARDGSDCIIDVFDETEGGGMARRCRIPLTALACSDGVVAWGAGSCEPLFSCNLLLGDCPPDVVPGATVIRCR